MSLIYHGVKGKRIVNAPIVPTKEVTIILVGDTHYGNVVDDVNPSDAKGSPIDRQINAILDIGGKPFPLGGSVGKIDAVIQIGDAVHEATENTSRFFSHFKEDGTGTIPFPCYVIDGNHDQDQVRTEIVNRWGSLNWCKRIGHAWFQAMTEDYGATKGPPDSTQINGDFSDSLTANVKSGEPVFICVHRSLSSAGYRGEWTTNDATSLDSLDTVLSGYRVPAILHGHDHYVFPSVESGAGAWTGPITSHVYKTISPGSIQQSSATFDPPWTTTFPEVFTVLRIRASEFDIAHYVFGYHSRTNGVLDWMPGTWIWAETVSF